MHEVDAEPRGHRSGLFAADLRSPHWRTRDQWWKSFSPGGSLATFAGYPTTLAGHPARVSVASGNADCVAGTKRSIQAAIGSVPSTDGPVLVMTACLTRPAQLREVMDMVGSLKIDA